ncbi:MAG: 50S ribosomal protein L13 [Lentisphaerae bacterium]|nr:50S ribosomal protein L13 [Lentisphaerota bacterium]
MKTTIPKENEIERKFILVDATDKILGRLAVKLADTLRGKDRPDYTPHIDNGCFVVVINAEKVRLTGKKEINKIYQDYSGYRGGLKTATAAEIRQKTPERLIHDAVRRLLPKNRLMRRAIGRLKVYAGPDHPHAAQTPELVDL